jgi:hypothetical protein
MLLVYGDDSEVLKTQGLAWYTALRDHDVPVCSCSIAARATCLRDLRTRPTCSADQRHGFDSMHRMTHRGRRCTAQPFDQAPVRVRASWLIELALARERAVADFRSSRRLLHKPDPENVDRRRRISALRTLPKCTSPSAGDAGRTTWTSSRARLRTRSATSPEVCATASAQCDSCVARPSVLCRGRPAACTHRLA